MSESFANFPPIYFVSFATNKYGQTLERIRQQAHEFGIFKDVICLNENDIEQEFWEKNSEFIKKNPTGHGCYIWKPKIVHKIFHILPDNSIMFYCDAGSSLFKEGLQRFKKYIIMLMHSKHDNLSFQMDLPEMEYTRKSIFEALDYPPTITGQLLGGIFFLRKTKFTENLVNLWNEYSQRYDLIGNVEEDTIDQEDVSFVANRHDQSLFSVLRKKFGTTSIRDETFFGEYFENFKQFPIHATRLKY